MNYRVLIVTVCFLLAVLSPIRVDADDTSKTVRCIEITEDLQIGSAIISRLRSFDVLSAVRLLKYYFKGKEWRERRKIIYLYNKEEYFCTLYFIGQYLEKYDLRDDNFNVILYQAASQKELNHFAEAITSYELGTPYIDKLNNVQQGRYSYVFFALGQLHHRLGENGPAISNLKRGLLLEPQNTLYQIFLGELYKQTGEPDMALTHFVELLDSPSLNEEERVVIEITMAKIPNSSLDPADNSIPKNNLLNHEGFSIKIIPINDFDPKIKLKDICLYIRSKFLLNCEILPAVDLNKDVIFSDDRDQFSGQSILDELEPLFPPRRSRAYYVLAITGMDIFGENTSFVFSWQNGRKGFGVVSSYRFSANLDDFYEPDIVINRRLGIQFISTISSMMGFERASKPHCPTAYPHSLDAFLIKGSKLCQTTISQRNDGLAKWGGKARQVDNVTMDEIRRVYKEYRFRWE